MASSTWRKHLLIAERLVLLVSKLGVSVVVSVIIYQLQKKPLSI